MLTRLKLETIIDKECETIRNLMIKIHDDEVEKWFKDGGNPNIPGFDSIEMQKYHTWDDKYFKIIYEDKIIGVTLISSTGREHGRIDRLYILPEYQGQGFGSAILKLIEESFPKIKIWALETTQRSPRNHHFYEKNGYALIYEDGEDKYYCKTIGDNFYEPKKYTSIINLEGHNFRECNMESADFYDTNMSNSCFSNMKLSKNLYQNSNLQDNRFTNVNLSGTVFGDSKMNNIEICHVAMTDAYIHDINMYVTEEQSNILFEMCKLCNSLIKDSDLKNVKIKNCNLEGMTIDGVDVLEMLEFYRKNNK